MKTITINVTQRDIDKGKRTSNTSCPIARALRRKVKTKVDVTAQDIIVFESDLLMANYVIKNPLEVQNFIHDFDNQIPVKPAIFRLVI